MRRATAATGTRLMGSGLYPAESGEPASGREAALRPVKNDLASLLVDAALRAARPRRHARPRNRGRGRERDAPPPAGAAGADRKLALPRRRRHRHGERPRQPSCAATRASNCRAPSATTRTSIRVADQLIAAAGVDDYTYIWWDVRPHPKLGTVEVRGMDVQTAAGDERRGRRPDPGAGGEGDRPARSPGPDPRGDRGVLLPGGALRPRGAADGRRPHRRAGARGSARVAREARPYADELGGEDALEEIERILGEGNGAEGQRRVHGEGGMEGLLADLAKRTRAPEAVSWRWFGGWDLQPFAGGDDRGRTEERQALAISPSAVAGAAADLELDQGGAAQFRPRLETAVLRQGVEGGLRSALTATEQAKGPVLGVRPTRRQLDLLAAEAADGDPALVAGPFLRSRCAHRSRSAHKKVGSARARRGCQNPFTYGSRVVFLAC